MAIGTSLGPLDMKSANFLDLSGIVSLTITPTLVTIVFSDGTSDVLGVVLRVSWRRVDGSDAAGSVSLVAEEPPPNVCPRPGLAHRPSAARGVLDCLTKVLVRVLDHRYAALFAGSGHRGPCMHCS